MPSSISEPVDSRHSRPTESTPHTASGQPPIRWHVSFEEVVEPTGSASPALMAQFLHELGVHRGAGVTASDAVRFSKVRGVPPFPVVQALRDINAGGKAFSVDDVTYEADDDEWCRRKDNRQTACCPVPRWTIGSVTGRQESYCFPCSSWHCPEHSKPKADVLLLTAKANFLLYPVIYLTVVADSAGMLGRISGRRRPERGDAHTLAIGRDDGKLHVFSTKSLGGYKPPLDEDWEALNPLEAVERLASLIKLPGVDKRIWSDRWPVSESTSEEDDVEVDLDGSEDHVVDDEVRIQLPSVQANTRERAIQRANKEVQKKYGFIPSEDHIPSDVMPPEEYADLLNDYVRRVRNENAWNRCAGR